MLCFTSSSMPMLVYCWTQVSSCCVQHLLAVFSNILFTPNLVDQSAVFLKYMCEFFISLSISPKFQQMDGYGWGIVRILTSSRVILSIFFLNKSYNRTSFLYVVILNSLYAHLAEFCLNLNTSCRTGILLTLNLVIIRIILLTSIADCTSYIMR